MGFKQKITLFPEKWTKNLQKGIQKESVDLPGGSSLEFDIRSFTGWEIWFIVYVKVYIMWQSNKKMSY